LFRSPLPRFVASPRLVGLQFGDVDSIGEDVVAAEYSVRQ
jgi:hypothetical protein